MLCGIFGFVFSSSLIFATVASTLNSFPDCFFLSFMRVDFLFPHFNEMGRLVKAYKGIVVQYAKDWQNQQIHSKLNLGKEQ